MATRKTSSKKSINTKTFAEVKEETVATASVDSKVKEVELRRREAALALASGLTAETAVQSVLNVSLEMSRMLSDVSQKLTEAVSDFNQVNLAIEAKQEELQSLYDREVVAAELSALVQKTEEQRATIREEKETFEQEQKAAREKQKQERDREQAEFDYKLKLDRRHKDDEHQQEDVRRQRELNARDEAFMRNHTEREAVLKAREKELLELRDAVAAFPAKLEKETATKVAIATSALKKDLEHKFALEQKDTASKLDLAVQRMEAANERLSAVTRENETLRSELSSAQTKIVEVASKGFDSFSGREAISNIREMSVAKDGGGQGKKG